MTQRRRHKLDPTIRRVLPINIDLAVENYLARLGARGRAVNTLKAYGTDLMQFVGFAYSKGAQVTGLLCQRLVDSWLDQLYAEGKTRRTAARKLTVVRMFARWCVQEGYLGEELPADLQVRYHPKRVTAPELGDLMRIIDAIKPTSGARALRDRALLRLSLDAGLRISEPLALNVQLPGESRPPELGIDLERRIARVPGKGGGVQTVAFNERTATMLRQWLEVRHEMARPGERALFVNQRGTRYHRNSSHTMLKVRAEAVGLTGMHYQLLRHRRIGGVLELLGDRAASTHARHARVTTTNEVYGHHAATQTQRMIAQHADLDAPTPQRVAA